MPNYWMDETDGELRSAICRYLKSLPLSEQHVALIQVYLRQWIMSPVWDMNPYGTADIIRLRTSINELETIEAIHRWIGAAVDAGIDPL